MLRLFPAPHAEILAKSGGKSAARRISQNRQRQIRVPANVRIQVLQHQICFAEPVIGRQRINRRQHNGIRLLRQPVAKAQLIFGNLAHICAAVQIQDNMLFFGLRHERQQLDVSIVKDNHRAFKRYVFRQFIPLVF